MPTYDVGFQAYTVVVADNPEEVKEVLSDMIADGFPEFELDKVTSVTEV